MAAAAKITAAYGAASIMACESNGGGVAWQSAAWQHGQHRGGSVAAAAAGINQRNNGAKNNVA
jgi:hypothetical protein